MQSTVLSKRAVNRFLYTCKKYIYLVEMDKILEAGLSTLLPRFNDEQIEPELIVAMTDAELTRLGVTTIGDRVRLRSICRKKKDIYTDE